MGACSATSYPISCHCWLLFGPKTGLAQLVSVDPFAASLCPAQDSPALSRFCAKLEYQIRSLLPLERTEGVPIDPLTL